MEDIRDSPVDMVNIPYLQGLKKNIHPRWLFGISSIHSMFWNQQDWTGCNGEQPPSAVYPNQLNELNMRCPAMNQGLLQQIMTLWLSLENVAWCANVKMTTLPNFLGKYCKKMAIIKLWLCQVLLGMYTYIGHTCILYILYCIFIFMRRDYNLSTIIISIYLQYFTGILSTKHDFYSVIYNLAKIPTKYPRTNEPSWQLPS